MAEDPSKQLRIATIFSYGANEAEADGVLDEENSEDTSQLDQTSRDFLDSAIKDYNEMFHTNYSTDGDRFQNYYKDVSLRMKNKELDLLIVVNMFLTGFDATTLNTLATRAIERGVNVKTLSDILGHSQVQITMDLYCHTSIDHMRDVMNSMSDLF